MPLYCESEYIVISFGHRLGTYISGKDVWWDYASEDIAKESFDNVKVAIEKYVLPWFAEVSTEEGYRTKLQNIHNKKLAEKWIDAIDRISNKDVLIKQSIEKLKLPKKMISNKEDERDV